MNYDELFFTIIKAMNKAKAHHWACDIVASPGVMMSITPFGGRWKYTLQCFSEIKDGKLMPPPYYLPEGSIHEHAKNIRDSWSMCSPVDGTPIEVYINERSEGRNDA